MIDLVVLAVVLLAAVWLVAGVLTFILGLIDASRQRTDETAKASEDSYETIHDGSNWLAGLFAALVLGLVGLFLYLKEKNMDTS